MIDLSVAALSRLATGGLVAAAWQGALLSLAVGLGLRLLPKTPAAVRFAIWFGVFAVVAVLPIVGLLHRGARVADHAPWFTLDARWCLVVAGAWGMASLMRAVTLVLAAFRVRTLWKRATPLEYDAFVLSTGGRASSKSAVRRRAELCVSNEVDRPTVIGFFVPRILIPTWLVEKLTPAELNQIVLHEAGHLSRADDWMNLLQKIALVVFPLNPVLAWVERRLCFERELACDEHVLRETRAPKAYAECLASLAEHRLGRRGMALALGALGRESELGRRVGRILRRGEMMRPTHARLVLGGAMLALLSAAAGLERCPEVVGFASVDQMKTAGLDHAIVGRTAGYQVQQVAFRVPAHKVDAVAVVAPASALRVSRAMTLKASMQLDQSAYRVPAVALRAVQRAMRPEATEVSAAVPAEANEQADRAVVQWLVVTAWQRDDGARIVMTSAQTSDATGRVVRTQSLAEPSQDQVHPYAAVPVRGGWLVFQL